MGVHPDYRKRGLGRLLYERFFDASRINGRSIVKSCTSIVNKLSINFHLAMGFVIEPGDGIVDGVPVVLNLHRQNESKVFFKKELKQK